MQYEFHCWYGCWWPGGPTNQVINCYCIKLFAPQIRILSQKILILWENVLLNWSVYHLQEMIHYKLNDWPFKSIQTALLWISHFTTMCIITWKHPWNLLTPSLLGHQCACKFKQVAHQIIHYLRVRSDFIITKWAGYLKQFFMHTFMSNH